MKFEEKIDLILNEYEKIEEFGFIQRGLGFDKKKNKIEIQQKGKDQFDIDISDKKGIPIKNAIVSSFDKAMEIAKKLAVGNIKGKEEKKKNTKKHSQKKRMKSIMLHR